MPTNADQAGPDLAVSAENWQSPPYNRWAYWHVSDILPTQPIAAGGAVRPLPVREADLDDIPVSLAEGPSTVGKILDTTFTDGLLVLHDGAVITERYFHGMAPSTRHLVMSVSKSIVGCVAGVLVERANSIRVPR